MKVLRSLYRFDNRKPVSDIYLMDLYKIPPPHLYLRQTRLIYFARFVRYSPRPLVSIVASLSSFKDSWYSLITEDLKWLCASVSQLNHFTSSDFSSHEFLDVVSGTRW